MFARDIDKLMFSESVEHVPSVMQESLKPVFGNDYQETIAIICHYRSCLNARNRELRRNQNGGLFDTRRKVLKPELKVLKR
jgi:hypothetical protein